MSASTPAVPAVPQFNPQVTRRRMAGTIFLGVCIAAIGILLIALVALLVDVVTKGVPWLDLQFLTGVPSRRAESAGILPALVGSLLIGVMVGGHRVPHRGRRGDLSPGVRRRQLADTCPADQHRKPGGRAVDHLRAFSASRSSSAPWASGAPLRGGADPRAPGHADRDHRDDARRSGPFPFAA